jgi:hypothetical protein
MTDDLEAARQRRQRRRETQPAGNFGVTGAKAARIDRVLAKVGAAAERNHPAELYAGKVPTPARITLALDSCELYGPEVDEVLGGEEPMVEDAGAQAGDERYRDRGLEAARARDARL